MSLEPVQPVHDHSATTKRSQTNRRRRRSGTFDSALRRQRSIPCRQPATNSPNPELSNVTGQRQVSLGMAILEASMPSAAEPHSEPVRT